SRDALGPYHPSARAIASDGSMFAELAFQSMSALLDLLMTHAGQIVVVQPQTVRDTIWQMTHDAVTCQQESAQYVGFQLYNGVTCQVKMSIQIFYKLITQYMI